MDGWCGDWSHPPSRIAIMSWGPNASCRACDQMAQSLAKGCSHCQIHLLGEGATCRRAISCLIQVPSPEQMSAMVRACSVIWQQLIEDKLLLENWPKLKKVSIMNWSFMGWRPRSGRDSEWREQST